MQREKICRSLRVHKKVRFSPRAPVISQLYALYIMFLAMPFSHLVSMTYVPPSFQGIVVGLANYY